MNSFGTFIHEPTNQGWGSYVYGGESNYAPDLHHWWGAVMAIGQRWRGSSSSSSSSTSFEEKSVIVRFDGTPKHRRSFLSKDALVAKKEGQAVVVVGGPPFMFDERQSGLPAKLWCAVDDGFAIGTPAMMDDYSATFPDFGDVSAS